MLLNEKSQSKIIPLPATFERGGLIIKPKYTCCARIKSRSYGDETQNTRVSHPLRSRSQRVGGTGRGRKGLRHAAHERVTYIHEAWSHDKRPHAGVDKARRTWASTERDWRDASERARERDMKRWIKCAARGSVRKLRFGLRLRIACNAGGI